jgi:WD40 repeat protein/serine/threonine protein kinase
LQTILQSASLFLPECPAMAKVLVSCPKCQTQSQVHASFLGKKARCKHCHTSFVLNPAEAAATISSPWPWVVGGTSSAPAAASASRAGEDGVPETWERGDVICDLYEVREVFTGGGMGLVYRVRHRGWNVDLAVKCPRPEYFRNEQDKENFKREAETWVKLGLHPHTVNCYYVRQMGGIPRVFAEFVAGGSLAEWVRSRTLYRGGQAAALERILDVAIQFAWGLQHAHEQGLVHRDVKPGNVLMTAEGIAKVTDFGMARARGRTAEPVWSKEPRSVLVSAGGMTPAYSSPEQVLGQPLSRTTDIWSWGVSVLEMFKGAATWLAGSLAADILKDYVTQGPDDEHIPRMPPALVDLLQDCFQKDPAARPRGMGEIVTALQEVYRQIVRRPYAREAPVSAEALAGSLNNRAVSLLDLNKLAEAERLWEEALAAGPSHPESVYNLGLTRWRAGRMTATALVEKLEEVAASHPGQWLPQYLLAQIQLEQGHWQAVVDALDGVATAVDEVRATLAVAREHLANPHPPAQTLEGHSDWVSAVALDGAGRLILSGSADRTLKLWEAATGQCLRTFEGHTEWVTGACLSGDGRLALSGSADQTLRLWDVAQGRCVRIFGEHDKWVTGVALSGDGRHALSGGGDGTVKLWEVATGKYVRGFDGHTAAILCVHVSPSGRLALSGGRDMTLKLWNVASGECLRTFAGHADKVLSACLSADGRYALSGSGDRTVKLWDVATGRCLRTFAGHTDGVFSVCLTGDGRHALSGSADRTIKFWRLTLDHCLATLQGHTGPVNSIRLSADGRYAVSGSGDRTVRRWHMPSYPLAPYLVSRVLASETELAARADYDQALERAWQAQAAGDAATAARFVRQARSQPGYERRPEAMNQWAGLYVRLARKALVGGWEGATLAGHDEAVTALAVGRDGRYFLSGGADRTLKLWETATGQCLRTFEGHAGVVTSAAFGAGGRHALSGNTDETLKLWDLATGQCIQTFAGHKEVVTTAALSGDERLALSGSADRTLRLWDTATGRSLRTYQGHTDPVQTLAWSTDGRLVFSGGAQFLIRNESERLFTSGQMKLWDLATGRCLPTFEGLTDAVTSVCLSGDGRLALSGSGRAVLDHKTGRFTQSGQLALWEMATGQCLRTFEGHAGAVTSVALTADGRHALSGGTDKALKLWESATGQCLRTFQGHTDAITAVAVSPDGRYAISASADRTIKLWVLDWELEDNAPADWDDGALPYLESFLTQHTPYAGRMRFERKRTLKEIGNLPLSQLFRPVGTDEELTQALTRRGKASWTHEDLEGLLHTLGCAGYGWLRPEGIQQKLELLARTWNGPPALSAG